MIQGRRTDLVQHVTELSEDQWVGSHSGLWLDKYIGDQLAKDEKPLIDQRTGRPKLTPQKALVDAVASIVESDAYGDAVASIVELDAYSAFFKRWETQLATMRVAIDGCEYLVESRRATVQGRLAIGLGDESVIETAVTLHHTYGVPFIPGSALKGLAAAYAHRFLKDETWRKPIYKEGKLIQKAGDAYATMFGTTTGAGYVTFFDALYEPKSGHRDKDAIPHALWPDVITVHHPDYYTGSTPKPPADWDSPTPVPFLTATGTYLISLGGPFAWVELTFKLLEKALQEMGIGAKTSSGYGRMMFNGVSTVVPEQSSSEPTDTIASDSHAENKLETTSIVDHNVTVIENEQAAGKQPKRGQDLWGKVIDRQKGRWIVQLEQSNFLVRSHDKKAKRQVDFGSRVRVRIEKTDPLEGFIKDVAL